MPRYIIEREVGEIDVAHAPQIAKTSMDVLEEMEGVLWIRSYLSEAAGKVYCEYDAPNVEAIYEHARRAGFVVTRVSEVAMEIEPSMFR